MAESQTTMKSIRQIFIVTGFLLIPGLLTVFLGWLYAFTPLLVFYYLQRYGNPVGGKYIAIGTLCALLVAMALHVTVQVLFAVALFPAGFLLARSAARKESPALAGGKGFLAVSLSWGSIWGILIATHDTNPYSQLLMTIKQGFDEILKMYRDNKEISAESLYQLSQILTHLQEWLIQFMPAILVSFGLFSIWVSMTTGNRLLARHTGQGPWPEYQFWKLPDRLVWGVIVAAILALLPVPAVKTAGYNLLLLAGVIYCFQGFSIVLYFLNKWNVSLFMRSLVYVLLFFQSLGTIFLSFIGLFDVWFDFRHITNQDQKNN